MVLQAGQAAAITVNKSERDALDQVLRRLDSALDEFERSQLESLLARLADRAGMHHRVHATAIRKSRDHPR